MTRSRDNATNVAGDISGVTAGTGLSGGGTNGSVTLDLSTPVASTNGGTGLSSFTTGDMIYSSSGNTLAKLGIGTTSQVLTVASGLPSWATPSSGGMTLISETVASALSGLSFTSLGSYKQLLLIWHGISFSGNGRFDIRLNNDSTTNIYLMNSIMSLGGTAASDSRTNDIIFPAIDSIGQSVTNTGVDNLAGGRLLLDNYTSTTTYKRYSGFVYFYDNQFAQVKAATYEGTYLSTSAVTSIDIVRYTGSQTFSNQSNYSIRLYGVS